MRSRSQQTRCFALLQRPIEARKPLFIAAVRVLAEDNRVTTCYIALGSNLGDRAANLAAAVDRLRATPELRVTKISSYLENPAVGGPTDSPSFLNAVVEIETTLPPRALLERLLEIERELGRVRREKWGPRVIDLDVLLYGDQVIDEPDLKIPHPLMHQREFVLRPLAEIAPGVMHPVMRKTVRELLEALNRR